jgi:hypothetical protein
MESPNTLRAWARIHAREHHVAGSRDPPLPDLRPGGVPPLVSHTRRGSSACRPTRAKGTRVTPDDHRDAVAPNNRDRARACRLISAMLSDDFDLVRHIIGEPQDAGDITRLILALSDEAVMALKHRTGINPQHVIDDRVQHFLGEAEQNGQ